MNLDLSHLVLARDEQIRKGSMLGFRGDSLFTVSFVWKDGDGNCCPTRGRITFTHRIFADTIAGRYYLMTVDWTRVPYVHPIDEGEY